MKKKMPLCGGPILPYKKFIDVVKTFQWTDQSETELKELLRKLPNKSPVYIYSLIKEIIFRLKNIRLFDSQLAAAYAMERGEIAELPTGEGKTLAAVVTAISAVLQGRQVQVMAFNDYLAQRDFDANREIFAFCEISAACILQHSSVKERKEAYDSEVLYITAKEAGFDYLRNFLVMEPCKLLNHRFDMAIIDEADSLMIDESRTPLVLAGTVESEPNRTKLARKIIKGLRPEHVELHFGRKQVWFTESGISYIEKHAEIDNLYEEEHAELLSLLHVMLEAEFFYKKDKEYIVRKKRVFVVEESTGRAVIDRKFPDYLQRAIEMKEGIEAGDQTMIFNSIPLQFFFLKYASLCGMTGTAKASAAEFKTMYGLQVEVIPPHTACQRVDHDDVLCVTDKELQGRVLDKIIRLHEKGQPILLGTQSVGESENYAKLIRDKGLTCSVLNARENAKEADVIARAGEPFRITISTNMAGRGVDIKLGCRNEADREFVKSAGGLFVISTGINRSRRIDAQLRGRAGRQGDPGESQFFISLQQAAVKEFFQERQHRGNCKKMSKVQQFTEGRDAQARYILEKYSVILEKQRRIISEYRETVLKDMKKTRFLQEKAPGVYKHCLKLAGKDGIQRAQQQLLLYYINQHWADYLVTMENARDGIHLAVIGREEPLHVYQKFAEKAFYEMEEDIIKDVILALERCNLTEGGVSLEKEGMVLPSSTWAYTVDENKSQFAKLPHLKMFIANKVNGT